jgi:hypothetical protein
MPYRASNTEQFSINRSSPLAAGLIGWWPLGAYPDGQDKSLYARHAIVGNGPPAVYRSSAGSGFWPATGGRRGLSFSGAGTNDYVEAGESGVTFNAYKSTAGESFTITGWLNPNSVDDAWHCFLTYREFGSSAVHPATIAAYRRKDHIWVHLRTDGPAGANTNWPHAGSLPDGDYTMLASGIFSVDDWTHFAFGRDESGRVFGVANGVGYKESDGTLSGGPRWLSDGLVDGAITEQDRALFIGDGYPGDTYGWDGLIDDVRIYNRELSDAELQLMYNQTRDGSYGDLATMQNKFHTISDISPIATGVAL